ncbi:MAG: hypothetical protein DMG26_08295 [Acidobacteria bacterium]|nr:MAG: hypothetical protein DMG26_08295 [Acidobacteriota bacterium]
MPALDSAATPVAAAHGDIKAARHRAPYDLFLILRCAALQLHTASAMRAARGQRDVERFIDARREGAAGASTVGATGFPAWGLGFGFPRGHHSPVTAAGWSPNGAHEARRNAKLLKGWYARGDSNTRPLAS